MSDRAIPIDGRSYQIDGRAVARSAIPGSVIDNFNEILYEDQNKTLSDYYSGDLSNYERVTSPTIDGTHSLEESSGSTDSALFSNPNDGLENYPEAGDNFAFFVRASTEEPFPSCYILGDGADDNGEIRFMVDPPRDDIQIREERDEQATGDFGGDGEADRWYDCQVVTTVLNGDVEFSLEVFDVDQSTGARTGSVAGPISATFNPTRTTGTLGFYKDSTGTANFDNVRLTE